MQQQQTQQGMKNQGKHVQTQSQQYGQHGVHDPRLDDFKNGKSDSDS